MNKFYGMVGMAKKGGKIIFGYDNTVAILKKDINSLLVIFATDASDKTKKNIIFECNKYNKEYIEYGEKTIFGKLLNKKEVSVLCVTDANMATYLKNNTQ